MKFVEENGVNTLKCIGKIEIVHDKGITRLKINDKDVDYSGLTSLEFKSKSGQIPELTLSFDVLNNL